MKQFQAIKLLILLFLLAIPSQSNSFTDLMREYQSFEQLITNDSPQIYLNDIDECAFALESVPTRSPKKNWTFIVYMASDNDLRAFAANNIRQMAAVGSNENVNIVAHLDIRLNGNKKVTRRYYIEKNKLNQMNHEPETQNMDSGDPKTLISCCEWAIENFPAEHYALIFWNHGTGVIDPKSNRIINPAELFSFNSRTNTLELDRSVGFLDFLQFADQEQRGICWDNTTGHYLTNQNVDTALNYICTNVLKKKFSLIGFDACLMSMIEIAQQLRNYSEVMVGSQEVELGTGWNYSYVLQPLLTEQYGPFDLAKQIIRSYTRTYQDITHDFTQSAIDLRKSEHIEKNIDSVARLLLEAIRHQHKNSVVQAIKISRSRKHCTHFDEPSYIDLYHFYSNLQSRIGRCSVSRAARALLQKISDEITQGKQLISNVVFSNTCGKNLKQAQGLSIYFPEHRIHPSYEETQFAKSNAWYRLIQVCK